MSDDLLEKLAHLGRCFLGTDGMTAKTLGIYSRCVAHVFDLSLEDQMRVISLAVHIPGEKFENENIPHIGGLLSAAHEFERSRTTDARRIVSRSY